MSKVNMDIHNIKAKEATITMKKYVKKVYLSIMLVVFSILTMVATTYAWVGLLTSSTFDEFTINLHQNEDEFKIEKLI